MTKIRQLVEAGASSQLYALQCSLSAWRLPCSALCRAVKSDSPSPKAEQVSKEKRERCWEHAVIYRMLCGLLHAGSGVGES